MPPRHSSTTVTAVGVLNLVAGCLGLIVTLISGLGLVMIFGGSTPVGSDPLDSDVLTNHVRLVRPEYDYVEIIEFGVGFLFDVMLLASGFGLLYCQLWARTIALTWAVMSFFNRLVMTGYTLLVVVPTVRAYYDTTLAHLPPGDIVPMKIGASIGGCMSGLLIAYPIIVFCALMSKSATAGFAPSPHDDGESDEDDDDPRRGRSRSRTREVHDEDRDYRGR